MFTSTEDLQMPLSPPSSPRQSLSTLRRKRRNASDLTQDSPPAKRIKSTAPVRVAPNFPPKFWDDLSKVWLTPRALRELDRRNDARRFATTTGAPSSSTSSTLARFARRGGPDLRHLRGYPEPKVVARMSSNRSVASSSRRTESTKATSVSSKAKRSSAYDKDFEQNLIDHSIYPKGYEYPDDDSIPEPSNLDDIVQVLSAPRASLSPSQFSRASFRNFALANDRVISEGKVMTDIFPTIRGSANIPNEGNLPFNNLDSITDGVTVDAVPDMYDGSNAKEVEKEVRQTLSKVIVPTSHGRAPLAPNFFVEAKAPRGGADVAKRQACLDGAIGARAMHSLQTYGENDPVYDGNAHSFSSTYHAGTGTLQLYAHHITGPTADGEQPNYHMTQLRAFALTSDRETFIQGAGAFRNVRDLAQEQRQASIKAANARALQAGLVLATVAGEAEVEHGPHEPIPFKVSAWQDSHDDLQQHIAETCAEECEGEGEAPTTPRINHASDESQDFAEDADSEIDPLSSSFVSNLTSSFSTDSIRPKRSRQSFSSPTQGSRSSKSRSRFATKRPSIVSPAAVAEPHSSDTDVSRWVDTHGHGKNVA